MSALITIITATWNRRNLLPRLYESLLSQRVGLDRIEWIVVDDGSTDGTHAYLRDIAKMSPLNIRVLRQENCGKHRALNRAALVVRTPWFLIVDSDDRVLPDGIALALNEANAAKDTCAVIAPLTVTGRTRTPSFQPGLASYADWVTTQPKTDVSILMRTHLLRETPFPEFEGETFIAETSFYARAFRNRKLKLSNTALVQADYQAGGLSDRSRELRSNNSLGSLTTYQTRGKALPFGRHKVRDWLNFHRFFWHAIEQNKDTNRYGLSPNPIGMAVAAPFYVNDRLQMFLGKSRPPKALSNNHRLQPTDDSYPRQS